MSNKNLIHKEAREKYLELSRDIKTAMMLTNLSSAPIHAIPMSHKDVLDSGDILFFSKDGSEHNSNIEASAQTQLIYGDSSSKEFLSVYGTTVISKNKELIDTYYDPLDNNSFENKEDPSLTVLIFSPEEGHYWDTKTNALVTLAKIAFTKITGNETQIGTSGSLRL
ncbi:pyridoxamine 5'-phosphate oxidase family protein [Nonlabens sp.]|uniref:pyridoxamine 5'-phosphate oxidase family protein n=1 Tax=Nonlabens sp. TaxID=1888209 RepID=UPI003F6A3FB4